jgi:predicted membrane protein (TIGR00267 family)
MTTSASLRPSDSPAPTSLERSALSGRGAARGTERSRLQTRAASLVRDVILGGQDGLVNVLGLVLGMAVATGDALVVTTAGLAALLAESIAMAGVAFTATGAEQALNETTRRRLTADREDRRLARLEALGRRLDDLAVDRDAAAVVRDEVAIEAAAWREELQIDRRALAPVRETRPIRAALVVGVSTAMGSSVPLVPFLVLPVQEAAVVALVAGAAVLAIAGAVRADLAGGGRIRAALEMVAIGVVSALAGFLIGRALRSGG